MRTASKITKNTKAKARGMLCGMVIVAVFVMLMTLPDVAIDYMKKALVLCARGVIPSLFPFMIMSELLVTSGIAQSIASPVSFITRRLFGIGKSATCVFILGTLCGFPVGARAAASMYDRGEISGSELCRVMTFSNNPSPAFVISTVGVAVLGSRSIGIIVYVCVILASLAVGIISKFLMADKRIEPQSDNASSPSPIMLDAQTFTDAIRCSAASMLNVCAYVTFFYTLVGCIRRLLTYVGGARTLGTLLFGFFELTSGATSAGELGDTYICAVACALFAGWSGMSVHFQIISAVGKRCPSYKPYFIAKAAQGVLSAALAALALRFIFPDVCQGTSDVFGDVGGVIGISGGAQICVTFLIASVLPFVASFLKKKDNW